MKLPEEFCQRMASMLSEDEYQAFLDSYDLPRFHGLRINLLKEDADLIKKDLEEKANLTLDAVPWAATGYYYDEKNTPGKHPYHEAGLYYIQEPSAMAPAQYLDVLPGLRILDLCAAPGGKSSQIASYMQGKGLLVSNEINPARAKILSENMERMGLRNALVTNESSDKLANHFGCFFHRIMVDAPCSGEGMFRKQDTAVDEWSYDNVKLCADRQDEIIENAYEMLLPGGRMVYSTCTFAPEENEGTIDRFLARHSNMHLVDVKKYPGMAPGKNEYADVDVSSCIRLFPHKIKGEGHFLAVLQKDGDYDEDAFSFKTEKTTSFSKQKEFASFAKNNLSKPFVEELEKGTYLMFGDQLYLVDESFPRLKGLKVVRPGLHLGTIKKDRFEPSHALALSIKKEDVLRSTDLSTEEKTIYAYLHGETFPSEGEAGWHLITVDGYSIGWGKLTGSTMKNHYPKGLRSRY